MIEITISTKNAKRGTWISGEKIISIIPGTSEFWSITFSIPLPIDTAKKIWGIIPKKVANRKFFTFTLNNVINEYNIYIFNTEQLKIRNQHILNYSNNINYIEWSNCNISHYKNCLKSKVFLIPYQVNFNEILNKTKINDVCMITKRQSEYRSEIFNECKKIIPNITSIVGFGNIRDELLFNHKILINASLEPNCSILEQFRVNRCIYNTLNYW